MSRMEEQRFNVALNKIEMNEKICRSLVGYTREMNLQIEAVASLLEEKGVLKSEEFAERFDTLRGLRKKTELEPIEKGDTVWVSYASEVPGSGEKVGEDSFPIRVGAGAVFWEESLLGKKLGESYSTTFTLPENYSYKDAAGKAMTFDIKILKVKTKINKEPQDGTLQS